MLCLVRIFSYTLDASFNEGFSYTPDASSSEEFLYTPQTMFGEVLLLHSLC